MKVKYTKQAFVALKKNIKRWENIRDKKENFFGSDCPLCTLIHKNSETDCEGCPIEQYTGIDDCRSTPYYDFVDKFYTYYGCKFAYGVMSAAQEEVDFLKKVLCKMLLDKKF